MYYFPDKEWKVSTPEQAGISSLAIDGLLERIEKEKMNLHGLILLHNGYIILEKYWDESYKNRAEHVFSVTKSVVSLLAGIAISENVINDDATVISYFPELAGKDVDPKYRKLKIMHLLTMSSGQEKDSNWENGNSISNFFDVPMSHEPGSQFAYMNGCATMVSAILQKETGMRLDEYAYEKLFSPIGIEKPRWEINPEGICYGGYGVWLKTRDIARIGSLLLSKGKWNDMQVVPENYVAKATSALRQSFTEGDPHWTAGYGYYFWQNAATLGGYHGVGLHGYYCIVLPEHNIVCATTAKGDMFRILHALEEEIIKR